MQNQQQDLMQMKADAKKQLVEEKKKEAEYLQKQNELEALRLQQEEEDRRWQLEQQRWQEQQKFQPEYSPKQSFKAEPYFQKQESVSSKKSWQDYNKKLDEDTNIILQKIDSLLNSKESPLSEVESNKYKKDVTDAKGYFSEGNTEIANVAVKSIFQKVLRDYNESNVDPDDVLQKIEESKITKKSYSSS